jgi:hypothetical protein
VRRENKRLRLCVCLYSSQAVEESEACIASFFSLFFSIIFASDLHDGTRQPVTSTHTHARTHAREGRGGDRDFFCFFLLLLVKSPHKIILKGSLKTHCFELWVVTEVMIDANGL